jgi:hypothetical protein
MTEKADSKAIRDLPQRDLVAASMFTLLFTAFLPKVGVQFPWVTYHWIAGREGVCPQPCPKSPPDR